LSHFEHRFRLAAEPGAGISCDENGLFVGETPMLERTLDASGAGQWGPRPLPDLNRDLSNGYELPVELDAKLAGLAAVARALGRGDLAHAQILALHLRLPDPPLLRKSARSVEESVDLARRLRASGLLKADWDPAKHPRWPGKSPDGVGGEFAPCGGTDGAASNEPSAELIPAQLTMPMPFDLTIPGSIPIPSEIAVPPLIGPYTNPRAIPKNPYPGRPECVAEWARAEKYCGDLIQRGLLGKGDYRGMGRTYGECVMGQISEGCGGNSLEV